MSFIINKLHSYFMKGDKNVIYNYIFNLFIIFSIINKRNIKRIIMVIGCHQKILAILFLFLRGECYETIWICI